MQNALANIQQSIPTEYKHTVPYKKLKKNSGYIENINIQFYCFPYITLIINIFFIYRIETRRFFYGLK